MIYHDQQGESCFWFIKNAFIGTYLKIEIFCNIHLENRKNMISFLTRKYYSTHYWIYTCIILIAYSDTTWINKIRDEALQENILIRYQVLGKETNNERHLVGSQNNVPVNSFLDRRMTTKKMHRIKRSVKNTFIRYHKMNNGSLWPIL